MKHTIPILALLAVLMAFPASAQTSSENPPQARAPQDKYPVTEENDTTKQMRRQQLRELNRQRQEQMKRDSDKLFQLATELKQYVDKTNENILSLEVLKKAEEIEKLAKSVREKMKTTYTETP